MKNQFELVHVGINRDSAEEAQKLAEQLSFLFNLETHYGAKSDFAGNLVECMKPPYYGTAGHIGLCTESVESAMEELAEKGIRFREESAAYGEDGKLVNIYLADEFAGFAIHILRK